MPWGRHVVRRYNPASLSAGLNGLLIYPDRHITSLFRPNDTSATDLSLQVSNPISAKKTENSNCNVAFSWSCGKLTQYRQSRKLWPLSGADPLQFRLQISIIRIRRSISSRECNGPCPAPGHVRHILSHVRSVFMLDGQKGKLRHCRGRISYTMHLRDSESRKMQSPLGRSMRLFSAPTWRTNCASNSWGET